MHWKLYFRLLRVPTSVMVTLAFVNWGWVLARFGLGPEVTEAQKTASGLLVTLGFLLPMMVGQVLATAAHTVLHRPFALYVPGLARRVQRWTGVAAAVVAVVLALGLYWKRPDLSYEGLVGSFLILLLFPQWSRRGRLAGFGGNLLVLGVAALVAHAFLGTWVRLVAAHGYEVLAVGVVFSGVTLQGAYCRTERVKRAFMPALMTIPVFRVAAARRLTAEVQEYRAQAGKTAPRGRDWKLSGPLSTEKEWLSALWHEQYGQGRTVWGRVGLFVFLMGLVLLVVAVYWVMGATGNGPASGYFDYLAQMEPFGVRFGGEAVAGQMHGMLPFVLSTGALSAMLSVGAGRVVYPISRDTLARVRFRLSLKVAALGCVLTFLAGQGLQGLGEVVTTKTSPDGGLTGWLLFTLLLASTAPWLFMATTIAKRWVSFVALLGAYLFTAAFAVAGPLVGTSLRSYPFVLALVAFTLIGFALYRRRLTAWSRKVDLNASAASLFGMKGC